MSRLLAAEEVSAQMSEHQNWEVDHVLTGQFEFADFLGSIAFVTALADEAEQMQHHPDIDIRYSKVILTLSTHDVGGLTQLDIELAKRAEQIFQRQAATPAAD